MPPPAVEVRPTIDRGWLERLASAEPVQHAYACWDLARHPGRVRFLSAVVGDRTTGYLLLWPGPRGVPIVHAYAPPEAAPALVAALPPRPLVAIVPPAMVDAVRRARGPSREVPERALHRPPGPLPPGPLRASVRRLGRSDAPAVTAWARTHAAAETAEYLGLDLGEEFVWGAFDHGGLVGVARAEVRLPAEWIVAGVYVEETARGRGVGSTLVDAAIRGAAEAGAAVGLFVRDDRPVARRLYAGRGFVEVARRVWMDLGADVEP